MKKPGAERGSVSDRSVAPGSQQGKTYKPRRGEINSSNIYFAPSGLIRFLLATAQGRCPWLFHYAPSGLLKSSDLLRFACGRKVKLRQSPSATNETAYQP